MVRGGANGAFCLHLLAPFLKRTPRAVFSEVDSVFSVFSEVGLGRLTPKALCRVLTLARVLGPKCL